jgi:hypothetical protein
MEENMTKYKANISFTYVDEINPENEQPGTCDITEDMFRRFFHLIFKDSELMSIEKIDVYYDCVFQTQIPYMNMMMMMQMFRFKVRGRIAKVADISIIVVS